ncbi:MAG TPA: FtsX-like permease family protein, partial [Planctomycetota bacterium]|nr:FtsX-like permease family protein [Planctomycetota bacterium]
RARIRGMQAHVVVVPFQKNFWISDYQELCREIEKIPEVEACAPRVEYEAWMGHRGTFVDVHIVGIVPEAEARVSDLDAYFRRGSMKGGLGFGGAEAAPGAVLGSELRSDYRDFSLMTARYGDSFAAGAPILLTKNFENVGYFRSGMAEYDANYVFMRLEDAQAFLRVGAGPDADPRVNTLAIKVKDYDRHGREVVAKVTEVVHRVKGCRSPDSHGFSWHGSRCGIHSVRTWEQTRSILLQAVDVEKAIMIIVLFMIVVVAGFNIISINTLVVKAKTRDIGILRALGATEGGIIVIFLIAGVLCGFFGSLFGIGLGLALSWNINGIADTLRIFSRELNLSHGNAAAAGVSLTVAFAALLWNWIVFYKDRRPHPWGRMAVLLVALAAAAWFSTAWIPGYVPQDEYDPKISGAVRWRIVLGFPLAWAIFAAIWRGLDRWHRRPAWTFFGFAGTLVLSAFAVVLAGAAAVADSITAVRPPAGWSIELFPRRIYYLDRIPVFVDYTALGFIVLLTLLVSLIFSIYPAIRASKANPIEAIRDE